MSDENNPSLANTECSPKRSKLETDGPDVKPNKVITKYKIISEISTFYREQN